MENGSIVSGSGALLTVAGLGVEATISLYFLGLDGADAMLLDGLSRLN